MKKVYRLENLDCANCARKMEDAIRKIDGVEQATISFMTQKLTLQGKETEWDRIMKEVAKACKRVDGQCEVVSL